MLSWWLDRWYRAVEPGSRTVGSVERMTLARSGTSHEPVESVEVGPSGLEGDARDGVRVANWPSLLELARGNEERALRCGVQLCVRLDLCAEGLPAGALLTCGNVVLRVTDGAPERADLERALGGRAARRVARHARRGGGARVLLCAVVAGGTIQRGDRIFAKSVGIRFQP